MLLRFGRWQHALASRGHAAAADSQSADAREQILQRGTHSRIVRPPGRILNASTIGDQNPAGVIKYWFQLA